MAEVTYHFNARGDVVWTDPDNIVDNNLETFGYTAVNGAAQVLTGNTCPADDLGTITKVELRLYGKGDGDDKIVITPVFTGGDGDPHDTVPVVAPEAWTAYVDITNDPNHPDWSLWSHIQTLDCKLVFAGVGKKNTVHCAKVEIRVTYTPPWVPPESDIDVGADPIDRTDLYGMGYTLIDTNNPANASGTLHTVKVYALGSIVGLRVGTFYATNGDVFKCRDSEFIGDVAAGAERTFTGLSIAVEEGDYIGCYYTAGAIECDKAGFLGLWGRYGEFIDPGDEAAQGFLEGAAISLYGYGDIEEVQEVTPSPVSAGSLIQAPSISGSGSAPVSPSAVATPSAVQAPSVSGSGTAPISLLPVAAQSAVVAPEVSAVAVQEVTPIPIPVSSSVQAPGVSGSGVAPIYLGSIATTSSIMVPVTTMTCRAPALERRVAELEGEIVELELALEPKAHFRI